MQHMGAVLRVVVLLLTAGMLSVHAEEGTVKATASWQGQGRFFKVRDKQALFAGAFSGIMFVETKPNTLDAAKIVCPGIVEVNLNDGTQSGEGRCIITTPNHESVYAMWNCAGEYLAGCKGTFTLLGGTGKFERITGKSDFLIRSDIAAYVVDLASTAEGVQTVATGLAVWPALTYKTP
jgi:hypothetical protein